MTGRGLWIDVTRERPAASIPACGNRALPFVGSEALAAGAVDPVRAGPLYTAILPNVYLDDHVQPTLRQRTVAAWLWSGGQAVVAGSAAAALHGANWVDDDVLDRIDLAQRESARAACMTRADLLLDGEIHRGAAVWR